MEYTLTLTKRLETGKGAARKLRREGKLPAVLYGQGEATPLTLDPSEFAKVLRATQQGYALISLSDRSEKTAKKHPVILKDIQYDPITGSVLHVDLYEVALDQPLQVMIPLVLTGSTPIGVTLGGVLRQRERRLPAKGLPGKLPAQILFDASTLDAGQVVKIKDLEIGGDSLICGDGEKIVVNIVSKTKVEEAVSGDQAGEKPTTAAT